MICNRLTQSFIKQFNHKNIKHFNQNNLALDHYFQTIKSTYTDTIKCNLFKTLSFFFIKFHHNAESDKIRSLKMQYIIIQYLIRLHKTTLFKTAIARSPEIHDLLRCERSMISWPLTLCRPPRTPVSLCEARRRFCWLHCPAHYSPSQNPSGSLLLFLCLFKRKINSDKSVCWQSKVCITEPQLDFRISIIDNYLKIWYPIPVGNPNIYFFVYFYPSISNSSIIRSFLSLINFKIRFDCC